MNIYKNNDLSILLTWNTYPGRGIVLGKTADGKQSVTAYFIMGRSENSRNRVFLQEPDGIRTEAHDPAKLKDPSLIIYHPVRQLGDDLIVTNEQGEEQRLSRTLLKKSGGETQIPFYISLLASFSQVCRIRSKGKDNTLRLIILDEAFSKMDGERIRESIPLLRRFGLQAVFSAPPGKIADIAPLADRNIVVYRKGKSSFTRHFDAEQILEQGNSGGTL